MKFKGLILKNYKIYGLKYELFFYFTTYFYNSIAV